jgi:hypothetical protein
MSTPRRRIVRPAPAAAPSSPQSDRRLQKLRTRLEAEHLALVRWMKRLKRAFHFVEKSQRNIARLQRQIAHLEE